MKTTDRIPASTALFHRKITRRQVAEAYGCSESFVNRVLEGREKAPQRFKELVAEMTGHSVELLWPDTTSQGER